MTTRDPHSRDSIPSLREPTQSLSIEPDELESHASGESRDDASHPSLALGTHDAGEERTRIDSPNAQRRTPAAAPPGPRPPPIPSPQQDPLIGSLLGSYRVVELLGKGGMGHVYRAEHIKLGREVALKLLRTDYARRRDAVARFFQEARTVNRVRHRNIVDVTDLVELDDGTTFIIMELLRGSSLGRWARSGVDLPRALAVLVQICDGLHAAHQLGVVHRDLKPDNVFVVPTSDGAEQVKLLDFGVAKLLNRDDEDVGFQTAAGSVIGTPAYMSPEQAGGMVIDARSDIYSLGAIMYELFCGQPMFRGRSFGEYVRKHLTEMPIPPRATAAGAQLDPRLELVILRSLEKDPNRRFGSILELRDALLGLLGGMDTHLPLSQSALVSSSVSLGALPALPPAMSTILPMPLSSSHPQPTPGSGLHPSLYYGQYASHVVPPQPSTTPWWAWFIGGAVAVGIGVSAALWYAGGSPSVPASASQPAVTASPIVTPPRPAPKPAIVEIKLDSLPSGGIYADAHAAELCRTPCTFNIDLGDGGPQDRRIYVIRAEGYKDTSVVVDLKSARRAYKVTLEQLAPELAEPEGRDETASSSRPRRRRPSRTHASRAEKVENAKPKEKPPEVKPEVKPEATSGSGSETSTKPTRSKPGKTSIDPTDLADPFKRKR